MMRVLAFTLIVALPAAGIASVRPTPSRLPSPRAESPSDTGRGGWDTRVQDKWDRQLRKCLNDRRQSKREARRCADMGMPTRR
jgi:hypothetical protein